MSEHKIELSERDASFVADALESPKAPNEKLKDAKKSYDDAIEQEIQAKGLTAPRVTPADIEANIAKEFYFNGQEAVFGACTIAHGKPVWSDGEDIALLTFCVLVLRNGFTVTGESACASPENFDAELGRKIARQNAVNKVWPLMGYALKEQLYRGEGAGTCSDLSGLVLTEADAIAGLKAADDRIIIGAAQVDAETEQAVVQMLCASARRCVEMALKCFRVGDIEGARAFSSEGAKMAEAIKQLIGDDDGEVSGLIRDIANFVDHLSGEPRPDAGQEAIRRGMTFGEAIAMLKNGCRVARSGWNGKGIFIELQVPDANSKMTSPYIFIDTTGLQSDNHFAPRSRVPWLASQTDMLSEDWQIV